MNEIELLTEQRINELSELIVKNQPSEKLMDVIRTNIKTWDKKLYPKVLAMELNYVDEIADILNRGGYEVDKAKLSVYLSRARGGKNGKQ